MNSADVKRPVPAAPVAAANDSALMNPTLAPELEAPVAPAVPAALQPPAAPAVPAAPASPAAAATTPSGGNPAPPHRAPGRRRRRAGGRDRLRHLLGTGAQPFREHRQRLRARQRRAADAADRGHGHRHRRRRHRFGRRRPVAGQARPRRCTGRARPGRGPAGTGGARDAHPVRQQQRPAGPDRLARGRSGKGAQRCLPRRGRSRAARTAGRDGRGRQGRVQPCAVAGHGRQVGDDGRGVGHRGGPRAAHLEPVVDRRHLGRAEPGRAAGVVEGARCVARPAPHRAARAGQGLRRAAQRAARPAGAGRHAAALRHRPERPLVDANFKEGQLRNLRIGQPATLVADVYGSKVEYHGTIEGLGAGTGSAFSLLPAQNATGNWIKIVQRVPVRIAIDPKETKDHPLRVGLSMDVKVDVRDTAGSMLSDVSAKPAHSATTVFDDAGAAADADVRRIIAPTSAARRRLSPPTRRRSRPGRERRHADGHGDDRRARRRASGRAGGAPPRRREPHRWRRVRQCPSRSPAAPSCSAPSRCRSPRS